MPDGEYRTLFSDHKHSVHPLGSISARRGIEAGALTPAQREALERYYGLDQPLIAQFFSWMRSVLTGNFGVSVTSGRPVRTMIDRSTLPSMRSSSS